MKRIEAFVRSEIAKDVVSAISKTGVGGVTLTQSLGKGQGDRPWVGGEKGHRIEFNAIDIVVTIVEDPKVEEVISAINKTARSGESGDGMIFISDITEGYNITTGKKINDNLN